MYRVQVVLVLEKYALILFAIIPYYKCIVIYALLLML